MILCARAIPSKVAVPLPTSSNKINDLSVAFVNALFTSNISVMNVDSPPEISSLAPILVNI